MNISFTKKTNTFINNEFIFGWFDDGCNIKCNKCNKLLKNEYGIMKKGEITNLYYLDDSKYNPINNIICYNCSVSYKLFTKLNCI